MSTESITSPPGPPSSRSEHCSSCGGPLAPDQRYCLECGERRVPVSEFLRSGAPVASTAPRPSTPPSPPTVLTGTSAPGGARNNNLSLLAGIGVLLLAMGVGVLIGRSGGSSGKQAPAQVITVGSTGGGTGSTGTEETFSSDWPSGTKGYTVELETLPESGTSVASVQSAKSAASGKGASSVGALKSEEFSSLTAGSYVIYSGVYHKRSEAQKALGALKKKFSSAKVIQVSESGSQKSSSKEPAGSGAGSNLNHPAPPSVLEGETHSKGKSYEEKSKNLPDVVSTG